MAQVASTRIILAKVYSHLFATKWRHLVYFGGRGAGKSQAVAYALLLRGRQSKLRILCIREFQNSIADSVHKLLKDLIEKHGFTDYIVQNETIVNKLTGTEFIFKGMKKDSQAVKSLEGVDICWVEEAQTISKSSIDILIPTIRKTGSQLIWTFNRLTELDPVYVELCMNPDPDTFVAHVNSDTLERMGQLPDTLIKEREKAKAKDPEEYAHIWLGEPIAQGENSIIPRTLAIQSMEQKVESDGAFILGVDVARMGKDRTVLWLRKGLKTIRCEEHTKLRTTEVVDEIKKLLHEVVEEYHPNLSAEEQLALAREIEIRVDDTGVGGGVTDGLFEDGWNVVPVNFGAKAIDEDKYPNWISEAWFNMKSIIRDIELPFNSDLLMELTSRQWKMDNKGKRRVESKDDYKKRGYRSPDLADAAIICYAREVSDDRIQFLDL